MFTRTVLIAGLACSSVLGADEKPAAAEKGDPPTAAPSAFSSQKDKVGYAIGTNIGKSLKRDGLELNLEALFSGLKDAFAGEKSKMTAAEMQATLSKLQEEMQAKASEGDAKAGEENLKAGKEFLAKNGKRPEVTTTASGLQYEVLKKGDGAKPTASDKVKVHYHGTLVNGTVFDSSVDRKEPASFPVGGVIKGWVEALQLMPVGSKWKLAIPSDLAYGAQGPGDIGANSTLIFEVELLAIEK